jgi:hypothetical protein
VALRILAPRPANPRNELFWIFVYENFTTQRPVTRRFSSQRAASHRYFSQRIAPHRTGLRRADNKETNYRARHEDVRELRREVRPET